jgi:pimeloyl-ACP methyl ester carboxylesterase
VPSFWSRELAAKPGTGAVAVDLPGDDENAGLPNTRDWFSRPSVVLANAMIPVPGETPGAWWDNTGWAAAQRSAATAHGYSTEFDVATYFLHDVPSEVAAEGATHQRSEANAVFDSVCNFAAWPRIPIRILAGEDDRFFPINFQRRVAHERLGVEPDVVPGGHLLALAKPGCRGQLPDAPLSGQKPPSGESSPDLRPGIHL